MIPSSDIRKRTVRTSRTCVNGSCIEGNSDTFDCVRRLIHKLRDGPLSHNDLDAYVDAELLNALLLLFVEPLIVEDSITVQGSEI